MPSPSQPSPTEPPPPSAPEPQRPPRRCAAEFQVLGGERFLSTVRDHLAYIYRVSPTDYDMIMTCDPATDATRVTRVVQVGPPYSDKRGPYSDFSGTIWIGDGPGPAAASLLVHEAAHVTRTGWNLRGSGDCGPENEALEWQASFVGRAALVEVDQRDELLRFANWLREQKNIHNCPAR
jgi:hypothetical protein